MSWQRLTRAAPRPVVSIADTLAAARAAQSSALVSAEAGLAVAELARRIPAALARSMYLECRLARDVERVDMILGIETTGLRIIAGRNPAISLDPRWLAAPFWNRAAELCRSLLDQQSPTARAIDRIWLEFDITSATEDPGLAPGVFLHFRRPVTASRGAEHFGAAEQAIRLLMNGRLPAATRRGMHHCLARLPAGASVSYLGVFPGRDLAQVRVCIDGLDVRAATAYGEAMGQPALAEPARAMLRSAQTRVPENAPPLALLHVEVGKGEQAVVGTEFALSRESQLRGQIGETTFLDGLVGADLCSAAKRRALEQWPGCALIWLRHELWRSLLVRNVNHVKLSTQTSRPIEAKAYLAMHNAPHPRGRNARR